MSNNNLKAFLRVIRAGESSQTDDAYRMMFGGSLFDSFADHPRRAFKSKWGWTSAAGAYQAMCAVPGKVKTDTWGDFIRSQGPHDFSPASQDAFAVWCIKRRGALDDVLTGRFETAIRKCAREWASLPFSPYGQPTLSLDKARAIYRGWGGRMHDEIDSPTSPADQPASPAPAPAPTGYMRAGEGSPQEPDMAPFIAAALPQLIQAAPALIRIFGDSPTAERNAKAAEVVAGMAQKVTGEATIEGAVNVIASDPTAASRFREEVHENMSQLLGLMIQAAEFDEKTRASAVDRALALGKATGGKWLWLLGGAAAAILLFAMAVTWQVLFAPKEMGFSDGVKMLLLGQVVLAGFALVTAFLFGTNLQNRVSQRDQQKGEQ